MAFSLPQFPLDVEIFTGPWLTRVSRVVTVGNLTPGRRASTFVSDWGADDETNRGLMGLLLPPGTDVRDASVGGHVDFIECPQGSGRWYAVNNVDDLAKGFDNEHRWVQMSKVYEELNPVAYAGLHWPIPIP